jgi:hypothetical protein
MACTGNGAPATAPHADTERYRRTRAAPGEEATMLRSFHFGPLSEKADDKGGSGGDTPPDQPKSITEEDVGRIVNSAVTAQLKRSIGPAITEVLGGLKLDEQIAAIVSKAMPKATDGQKKPDERSTENDAAKEYQRQLTALQERLDASERKSTELDKQRIELEQKNRFDSAKAAFRAGVQTKIKPELLDPFIDYYSHVKGVLKVDDAGSPMLTVKRAPYKGAPLANEDLPLAEALPLLLATDDVKPFLPAPGGHQEESKKGQSQIRFQTAVGKDSEGNPAAATLAAFEKLGIDPGALS